MQREVPLEYDHLRDGEEDWSVMEKDKVVKSGGRTKECCITKAKRRKFQKSLCVCVWRGGVGMPEATTSRGP